MGEHGQFQHIPEPFSDHGRAGKLINRFGRAIAAEAACVQKSKGSLDSARVVKRLAEHKRQVGGNYWKLMNYVRALEDALPEPLAASIKVQDSETLKLHSEMIETLKAARKQLVLLGGERRTDLIGNEVHQSVLYAIDCVLTYASPTPRKVPDPTGSER